MRTYDRILLTLFLFCIRPVVLSLPAALIVCLALVPPLVMCVHTKNAHVSLCKYVESTARD